MCAQGFHLLVVGPRAAGVAARAVHGLPRSCHHISHPICAQLPEPNRAQSPAVPHPDPG